MYVCVSIYLSNTHKHTHMYGYINGLNTHINVDTQINTHTYVHTNTHIHLDTHTHMYTDI